MTTTFQKVEAKEKLVCEGCEKQVDRLENDYCDDCYEYHYCECGRSLETPGDGLCRRCD